jgi:hypothetical protein
MVVEFVAFKNGRFGIRRTTRQWFRKPKYEFLTASYWYWREEDDKNNIYFDTLEQAQDYYDNGAPIADVRRSRK